MILKLLLVFFYIANIHCALIKEAESLFGKVKLDNGLAYIFESDAVQRLGKVGLYSPWTIKEKISRLDHALDVLWLVQRFGGDITEQAVALTHDIARPAFSHVAGIMLIKDKRQKKHEELFEQLNYNEYLSVFISKSTMQNIKKFPRFSQDLPNMSADRIAYILRTGFMLKKISQKEINTIIKNLRFQDGKWFFVDKLSAIKIAELSLSLTQNYWSSNQHLVLQHYLLLILQRLVKLQRIKLEDLYTLTDEDVIHIIKACDDKKVRLLLSSLKTIKRQYSVLKTGEGSPSLRLKPIMRGVDPLIYQKFDKKFVKLSDISLAFKNKWESLAKKFRMGNAVLLKID